MSKPRVYITREIPSVGLELIKKYFEVEVWPEYWAPPREILLEKVKNIDGLVSLLTDKIDAELLDKAKNLKIISQYAVGYDNIDLSYATKKGVYVTNTPGVLTDSTADLTFALILAITRRIVEADKFVRDGSWERSRTGWHPLMLLGMELKGKTLGIIGMGRIGRAVAQRALGFEMNILYYDVNKLPPEEEKRLNAQYASLEELLEKSDVVSIHTDLNKSTYHLINEERLKRMKKTAYIINVARGPIIDTQALVKALKEGWIAGAGLDVFESEPLPSNHELTKLNNVVIVPHIGSATHEARNGMAMKVATNLIEFLNGRVPPDLVNKEVVNLRKPGFY
ncbi:glyoxylate reductase [Fervidicoccus fontis]|uniref:D-glycerate dehydrogenase n=1 Tax=Fervidicoccus fontis TaxID=683846 RepID=A0A2J6N3T1_9CREN|nr:glyoxylate reductase [Fervidicoccus fontis]PMB75975.1 MAG: D-glycerate dehydrogenase [Fervidicoccus fontis]PMB77862.1 MAG: D-glycerate dehydrogenase [Fervidicoccus fontis]HEW63576.1 D-glycerate dehydrogenase [Fervidicoccus fontis]